MIIGVFILVATGGLFWLAYRRPRPRRWLLPRRTPVRPVVAAVDRQHRHLQSGGLIGETTFEATKAHLRELLAGGRAADVEGELRPGLDFAVRVRALAELGTDEAGRVLEKQLARTLSRDPVEQAWYWVDVAAGLRRLGRAEALPAVLRCADAAAGIEQGAVLAAEAVAFPSFSDALRDPDSAVGRLAVRALTRAARGSRDGAIDVAGMVRAGLGDHLAAVSESLPPSADPLLTAAVLEAERVFRRLGHWARLLGPDVRPLAERQALRLWASADSRAQWLATAPGRLAARFPAAPADEQAAALHCLAELRADVTGLFSTLPDRRAMIWTNAVTALTWAKSPVVGPVLAAQAAALLRSRRSAPSATVALAALRGHRCPEAEGALLGAVTVTAAPVRRAAFAALGWWDPFDPDRVVGCLRAGRADPDPAARRAAVAALARLGERSALRVFADALAAEEPDIRRRAAREAAEEGLSWLWPDLEAVAGGTDPDAALAAAEAIERLREQFFGPVG
jgi:hypothetical protein